MIWRPDENWQGRPRTLVEPNRKNALVIGVGGVGPQIATRDRARGMSVVGVDPEDIAYHPFVDKIVNPDMLDSVVRGAGVVLMGRVDMAAPEPMPAS